MNPTFATGTNLPACTVCEILSLNTVQYTLTILQSTIHYVIACNTYIRTLIGGETGTGEADDDADDDPNDLEEDVDSAWWCCGCGC
jgi:hypothetical protein